jgi:hypothetical protein
MPRKSKFQHRKKEEQAKRAERARADRARRLLVPISAPLPVTSEQSVSTPQSTSTEEHTDSSDNLLTTSSPVATSEPETSEPELSCAGHRSHEPNVMSPSLQQLHLCLSLPPRWSDQSVNGSGEVILCKICPTKLVGGHPLQFKDFT